MAAGIHVLLCSIRRWRDGMRVQEDGPVDLEGLACPLEFWNWGLGSRVSLGGTV